MSKTKLIQSSLAALCEMGPKVKTWANLPNDMLYQIGLARIESMQKGIIYLPREIEEKVNEMLESHYHDEIQRSRSHYIENGISLDETLYCQYGVLDSILLSY
jgi:hypothetical protein